MGKAELCHRKPSDSWRLGWFFFWHAALGYRHFGADRRRRR